MTGGVGLVSLPDAGGGVEPLTTATVDREVLAATGAEVFRFLIGSRLSRDDGGLYPLSSLLALVDWIIVRISTWMRICCHTLVFGPSNMRTSIKTDSGAASGLAGRVAER